MKTNDLRKRSEKELLHTANQLRSDLFDVRFRREVDQVADLNVMKRTRRDLARVLTVLRERQIGLGAGSAGSQRTGGQSS